MTEEGTKVAIITAASSGMGVAITKILAQQGFAVGFAARREDRGRELEEGIKAAEGKAVFIQADLTREEDIKNFHERALSLFGHIDVAVNNAGAHRGQTLTESSVEDYNTIKDTNVKAVWLSTKYQIEAMRQHSEGGSIINIAFNVAHNGAKNAALYVMSKHAVLGLNKAAAFGSCA